MPPSARDGAVPLEYEALSEASNAKSQAATFSGSIHRLPRYKVLPRLPLGGIVQLLFV